MIRIIAVFAMLLLGSAAAARASEDAGTGPAARYCVEKGGVVQTRIPTYGTNGSNPLTLAYPQQFCDFTARNGDSSIYVKLDTLFSRQPTLAALAYYAEVPFNSSGCNGGPGSCYCAQLGGTDAFGGINSAGGGWVLSTDSTDVLDACIFPDLSVIDSYGLFYHSAGIILGRNLVGRLRYKNPN